MLNDTLALPDPNWLTGAIPRTPGLKDWHLENAPGVAEAAADLPPAFAAIKQEDVKLLYTQIGASCVPTSTCTVKSIEDWFDVGAWNELDPQEIYKFLGGTGSNGVSVDRTLQYARDFGCSQVGSTRRWKIGGYAFAPQQPGVWRRTLAAALVASGPTLIDTLLPQKFGWDSEGPLTSGYHQLAATEYDGLGDNDHLIGPNTWGRGWGNGGFYRLTWGMLEGRDFQNVNGFRHAVGSQVIDIDDADLPPPVPIPDPSPIVTPVISRVKYKKLRGKIIVIGADFHSEARLILDGRDTGRARNADGRFVYRQQLRPGGHLVQVVNPSGKRGEAKFDVA